MSLSRIQTTCRARLRPVRDGRAFETEIIVCIKRLAHMNHLTTFAIWVLELRNITPFNANTKQSPLGLSCSFVRRILGIHSRLRHIHLLTRARYSLPTVSHHTGVLLPPSCANVRSTQTPTVLRGLQQIKILSHFNLELKTNSPF